MSATTCGHPVPEHHRSTWGIAGDVYCSLECMAATMPRGPIPTDPRGATPYPETLRHLVKVLGAS